MGGIEVVEDLTDQQLQAQAGGEALKFEAAPIKVIFIPPIRRFDLHLGY